MYAVAQGPSRHASPRFVNIPSSGNGEARGTWRRRHQIAQRPLRTALPSLIYRWRYLRFSMSCAAPPPRAPVARGRGAAAAIPAYKDVRGRQPPSANGGYNPVTPRAQISKLPVLKIVQASGLSVIVIATSQCLLVLTYYLDIGQKHKYN